MKSFSIKPPSAHASSRSRSFLRDVACGIGQQMFFWGCDVRHPKGNLLVALGMERLARECAHGEGSSRYRMPWKGGLIELHSFCVGWYPSASENKGAIFIRGQERLLSCQSEMPLTPGRYENERFSRDSSDELLITIRPLLAWIVEYEEQIENIAGPEYRPQCWKRYLSKIGARPWLSPAQSMEWYRNFLDTPEKVQRPKEIRRRNRTPVRIS